jgi:lipoprotein-anchoring transpeptidase ErfK/SrfK
VTLRLLRLLGLLAIVVLAIGVTAPTASPPPRTIAPGVVVAGVKVGGLTSEPARDRLRVAATRGLRFQLGDERWSARAERFGASASVNDAVARALTASPRSELDLEIGVDRKAVRSYVRHVARRFDRAAVDAALVGLDGVQPIISSEQQGQAVRRLGLERLITRVLRLNVRDRIHVPLRPVAPNVTESSFGPVIVINRGGNSLYLYNGESTIRSFRVATGTPEFPTPSGRWQIVDMQRNPWWRPPPSDWAKGLEPVPPGPGNPLGTRWMGLDASAVGIHGTPDAASLGYSRSHGCIRMAIPEAEWLFEQVRIGTPVMIV